MPIAMVEHYYQMIQHLSHTDKMVLVEKIIHSVNNPQQPLNQNYQDGLFGSWEDERIADEIIQDIKGYSNDVVLEKDIDKYSSLNYLTVTQDKTDENWLNNIFAIADKAFKESELNGVVLSNSDDRGWTRDEIYER